MPVPDTRHPTVNLSTYRASGEEVRTPVWYIVTGNTFWVSTFRDSWKAKRLRKNTQVRFAPCDSSGKRIFGDWAEGSARLDETSERQAWLTGELKKRYTWRYFFIVQVLYPLLGRRGEPVAIEVTPNP